MACSYALPQFCREDSFGFLTRYDRRVDFRPTTNIDRRKVIRQASEPADPTGELRLRDPIGFTDVTTHWAGPAGVIGIHKNHRHTSSLSLVSHKAPQLGKRPAVEGGPLRASNRCPQADARQFFQGQGSVGVFRFGYQMFADAVVGISCKSAFLTRQALEFALGGGRAFGLEFGSQEAIAVADMVDRLARMDLPLVVDGNVDDAQIHAQGPFNHTGLGFLRLTGRQEEKSASGEERVAFALAPLKQFPLAFSTDKRDEQPAVDGPDRDGVILQSPGQDAVIKGDTPLGLECPLGVSFKFIGIGHFGDHPDCQLSRQSKPIPDCSIAAVMQIILAKGLRFPGRLTDPLSGRIGLKKGLPKGLSLIRGYKQLKLGSELHGPECNTNVLRRQSCNPERRGRVSSAG